MQNCRKDVTGLPERIEGAFKTISERKDAVGASCDNNFSEGITFGLSGTQLIKLLNAYALLVGRYACDTFFIDFLLELEKIIDGPMMGVSFNKAEPAHLEEIKEFVSPFLNRKDMEVFGFLPWDTLPDPIRVQDMVDYPGGDVVCGSHRLDGMVGNCLVGAVQVDMFIRYLLKNPGSAVIVGGDRTDIQLVAVENGVRCLMLS